MEIEIVPLVCSEQKNEAGEVVPASFEGFVKVKVPSFPERCRFPKQLGIGDLALSEGDPDKKVASGIANLEVVAKAAELMEPFLIGVSLKHLKTGTELKSVEDLYSFPQASPIVVEIAGDFINGFQPKN